MAYGEVIKTVLLLDFVDVSVLTAYTVAGSLLTIIGESVGRGDST